MYTYLICILLCLFVKHYYVDFVNQTDEEVKHKGIYLHWLGVKHSLKQALFTFIIFVIFGEDIFISFFVIAALDFLLHYHIDYVKMKYGERDITKKAFWNHLGLDQLLHNLTYLFLVYISINI